MSKVYRDDKMLRYTTYYVMGIPPENVSIKSIYEKLVTVGEECLDDFKSEVYVQTIEWLFKYQRSYGPGDLKSYLERVMPYTMSSYLRKNRKYGYLPLPEYSVYIARMSDIKQYDDIRRSIIEFGVAISGKTTTDLANELGLTYRAARYIMNRS